MPEILPARPMPRDVAAGVLVAAQLAGPSPTAADEPRHLIYPHDRIVQEEPRARPRHPRYGLYELEAILAGFRARGFVASGEMRPKRASVTESGDRVVAEVRGLLDAGVAAERITVVGGSMGAAIALLAAVRLQNPDLRFALLGACVSESARARCSLHRGLEAAYTAASSLTATGFNPETSMRLSGRTESEAPDGIRPSGGATRSGPIRMARPRRSS